MLGMGHGCWKVGVGGGGWGVCGRGFRRDEAWQLKWLKSSVEHLAEEMGSGWHHFLQASCSSPFF